LDSLDVSRKGQMRRQIQSCRLHDCWPQIFFSVDSLNSHLVNIMRGFHRWMSKNLFKCGIVSASM
jgi:hypothetical protein